MVGPAGAGVNPIRETEARCFQHRDRAIFEGLGSEPSPLEHMKLMPTDTGAELWIRRWREMLGTTLPPTARAIEVSVNGHPLNRLPRNGKVLIDPASAHDDPATAKLNSRHDTHRVKDRAAGVDVTCLASVHCRANPCRSECSRVRPSR